MFANLLIVNGFISFYTSPRGVTALLNLVLIFYSFNKNTKNTDVGSKQHH